MGRCLKIGCFLRKAWSSLTLHLALPRLHVILYVKVGVGRTERNCLNSIPAAAGAITQVALLSKKSKVWCCGSAAV
jgi:hypothetical protein